MNHLYSAVMVLGRAIEDIRTFGWVCGDYGAIEGPKCVNGAVTMATGAQVPGYIATVAEQQPELAAQLHLVAVALYETAPAEVAEEHGMKYLFAGDSVRQMTLDNLSNRLIDINDAERGTGEYDEDGCEIQQPCLTEESALAWFERAFDKLAAELPEPIPADPLTVEQIVGASQDEMERYLWSYAPQR